MRPCWKDMSAVRCTLCLERNPHIRPIGNARLVTINERDVLVCRSHMPKQKAVVEKCNESNHS